MYFFQIFKGIASELNVSRVDPNLSRTVSKNVAKTVKLMCVKCEGILSTDGEASQVVGYATEGQKRNVAIVNCLTKFREGIVDILQSESNTLGAESISIINESLEDVDKLVRNAISPLLSSVQDAVEAILLTIHNGKFNLIII